MTIRMSVDTSDPPDAAAPPKRKITAVTTADMGPPIKPARGTSMTLNPRMGLPVPCQSEGMLMAAAKPKVPPIQSEKASFYRERNVSGMKL